METQIKWLKCRIVADNSEQEKQKSHKLDESVLVGIQEKLVCVVKSTLGFAKFILDYESDTP